MEKREYLEAPYHSSKKDQLCSKHEKNKKQLDKYQSSRGNHYRRRTGFCNLKLAEFSDLGSTLGLGDAGAALEAQRQREAEAALKRQKRERERRREREQQRQRQLELQKKQQEELARAYTISQLRMDLDSHGEGDESPEHNQEQERPSEGGTSKSSKETVVLLHQNSTTYNAIRRYSLGRRPSILASSQSIDQSRGSMSMSQASKEVVCPEKGRRPSLSNLPQVGSVNFNVEDHAEKILNQSLEKQASRIEGEIKQKFLEYALKCHWKKNSDEIDGAKFVQLLRDQGVILHKPDFTLQHADVIFRKASAKDPFQKMHYTIFRMVALPMVAQQLGIPLIKVLELVSGHAMPDFTDIATVENPVPQLSSPTLQANHWTSPLAMKGVPSPQLEHKSSLNGYIGLEEDAKPKLQFNTFEYLERTRRNSLRQRRRSSLGSKSSMASAARAVEAAHAFKEAGQAHRHRSVVQFPSKFEELSEEILENGRQSTQPQSNGFLSALDGLKRFTQQDQGKDTNGFPPISSFPRKSYSSSFNLKHEAPQTPPEMYGSKSSRETLDRGSKKEYLNLNMDERRPKSAFHFKVQDAKNKLSHFDKGFDEKSRSVSEENMQGPSKQQQGLEVW